MPSSIVRFRPTGPWRFGPDSGTRDRVDLIYHSDTLYAAVTSAMLRLNLLDEWLGATARHSDGEPQVRFSSLFPFQRDILFVTPPRNLWPPPASTKIRYKSARFVPLNVVKALVAEQPIDENRWIIDGESQCMIPSGEGPFRIALRSAAAVDRVNPGALEPHITACIEFGRDAGLWTMVVFANEEAQGRWKHRVRGALRLLADTGFGGERSRGWGRASEPEWQKAPELWVAPETDKGHWMLSVYAPAASDNVDWKTGNYSTLTRTGRIESKAQWGALKPPSLMIAEGSVLVASDVPRGEARDVAPEGFAHPVYRAGFGVSILVPWKAPGTAAPVFSAQKAVTEVAAAKPVAQAEPFAEVAPELEPTSAAVEPESASPAESEAHTEQLSEAAGSAPEAVAELAPPSQVVEPESGVVEPETPSVPESGESAPVEAETHSAPESAAVPEEPSHPTVEPESAPLEAETHSAPESAAVPEEPSHLTVEPESAPVEGEPHSASESEAVPEAEPSRAAVEPESAPAEAETQSAPESAAAPEEPSHPTLEPGSAPGEVEAEAPPKPAEDPPKPAEDHGGEQ